MSHSRRGFLLSASAGALGACTGGARITIQEGSTVIHVEDPRPGPVSGTAGLWPWGPDPAPEPADTGDTGAPSTTTGDTGEPGPPGVPGPEPASPWSPAGLEDSDTFSCGVQTGDVTATGVVVQVRQFAEPTLRLVLARGEAAGWVEVAEVDGLVPDDDVLRVELEDLWPDHTYSVVFYTPDGLRRSRAARFRTALEAGTSRTVRIGASSCLGNFASPWPTLTRAADELLDVFLLLGDTIYADEGGGPASRWDSRWTNALRTRGLNELTASTSVVATWDDHEVTNNWSWDQDGAAARSGLDAFRRGMPMRTGPGGSGLWRRLSWGDAVDLFALDCRGERGNGDYLSRDQMDWLKLELSSSTARFKVILNSVPIADLGLLNSDGWMRYPRARQEILSHIRDQGIPGVLWVAGDVHWACLCSVDEPGRPFDDALEVFAGPGGSAINPGSFGVLEVGQYRAVVRTHNWLSLECDPAAGTVTVTWFDNDGRSLARRVISP